MATIDIDQDVDDISPGSPEAESAIVRQMVELVDALLVEGGESAATAHSISAYLEIISRAWPATSSIAQSRYQSTSEITDDFSEMPQPEFGASRFEIRRLLGHGGFGVVLLAFDRRLGREVALKVPRPEILVSRNMRSRFLGEAQAAAALDHPNIVPVYDTGEIGPIWFIVSRYVPGLTLCECLRQKGEPMPSMESAELIAVLAAAVHHAHSRGVLHRDLKPANILLEPVEEQSDWRLPFAPRLSDFGLSRRLDAEERFTQHGALLGTPRYMAPEQAAARYNEVGIQTDVHALGVILYEMLTGKPPFVGDSDLETMRRIEDEPAAIAPLRDRRIPRDLQTICLKCLEKKPSRRYDTAGELAADLRHFLAGEPVGARPVGALERMSRWCRRRPLLAALYGALALVSATGIAGISWQWMRAEHSLMIAQGESARAEENLRQLEFAFIDLGWMFEEAELLLGSEGDFPKLLENKLRDYANGIAPQYLIDEQIPKPIAAALHSMNAKQLSLNGDAEAAEQGYRESIELWRQASEDDRNSSVCWRGFATTLFSYTRHVTKSRDIHQNIDEYALVQKTFSTLKMSSEDEIRALENYADLMTNLGHARSRRREREQALKAFQLAYQIRHEVTQRSPNQASARIAEALALSVLATRQHRALVDLPGALSKTQQARRLLDEAVQMDPDQIEPQFVLANTLFEEGVLTNRVEGPSQAIAVYERSIDVFREALQNEPHDSRHRQPYGNANLKLGQILLDLRGPAAALPFYEVCADNWSALYSAGALSRVNEGNLTVVYARIGRINDQFGRTAAAITAFRHSNKLATSLREQPTASRKATTALVDSSLHLGDLLGRQGHMAEAADYLRDAVHLLTEQSNNTPNNSAFIEQLKAAKSKLAELNQPLENK